MAFSNLLLLCQITGYIIAFILSLCITVPMSIHQDEFRGHCLLFSTGVWQEKDGQFGVNWASQAYCNYTIFVGVILFITSVVQIYRMGVFLYRGTDSSFLSAFVDVVGSVILCLMTIVAALMITLGFMVWCKNMTERFPSCEIAAGNSIDKQDGIETAGFYIEMGTAQVWLIFWVVLHADTSSYFYNVLMWRTSKKISHAYSTTPRKCLLFIPSLLFGAWASWACWVGLSVCALLKLCKYHQLENIRVSMYRERQRLLNGGGGGGGNDREGRDQPDGAEKDGPDEGGGDSLHIPPDEVHPGSSFSNPQSV